MNGCKRLGVGEVVATGSALLLLAFMFFRWYGISVESNLLVYLSLFDDGGNAWHMLDVLPVWPRADRENESVLGQASERRRLMSGDSGSPVWNLRTGASIGLVSGSRPPDSATETLVAPLLHPPNMPANRVPGILHHWGMALLQLKVDG